MLIQELITKLGFDVDTRALSLFDDKIGDVQGGLDDLGTAADEAVEQMKSAMTTMRNIILGVAAATAVGGASLAAMVKSAANVGDTIDDFAPILGMSAEEFQKYRYAAKFAGVENESFIASTQFLIRTIGDARSGNEAAIKSFARLGISVGQLEGKTTAEVYGMLADRLSAIEDPALRASMSIDVLGRSGALMGGLLAKGRGELEALMGDVEAFGMFTDDSAQASGDLNDALDQNLFLIGGIKNAIGQGLFPIITKILTETRNWIVANREVIRSGIEKFVNVFTAVLTKSWSVVKQFVRGMELVVGILGGYENAIKLLGIAIIAPLLALIGPIYGVVKATGFLLFPFLRLHTLLTLVTFALGALMPLWTLMVGVASALAASKLVIWLVQVAGGLKAIAAAALIPLLKFLAISAAIAFLIIALEDLYVWLKGGDSIIGSWLGKWEIIPGKLKKIWDDIKAVFVSGGKFMVAVLQGDFKKAYEILGQTKEATVKLAVDSEDLLTGGKGINNRKARAGTNSFELGAGGYAAMMPSFAGSTQGIGTGISAGPGPATFVASAAAATPRASAAVTKIDQTFRGDINLNLPPGTSEDHAKKTAEIIHRELGRQIDHSLQQSVPPGR